MNLPPIFRSLLLCVGFLIFTGMASGHPIPDIPVRGAFQSGGKATFYININPRCFDADPVTATSLTRVLFNTLSEERKGELLKQAEELAKKDVEFYLEPIGRIQPEFHYEFTGEGRRVLEADDSVVIISGSWSTDLPAGITGWNIRSTKETKVSVVFENEINGESHPRVAVLFPGERSFTMDLTQLTGAVPTQATPGSVPAQGGSGHLLSTVWSFCKQGFGHVVPDGLDHILFVLGIFLLGRAWRPLLYQVSAFTLAHSVTLALATLAHWSLPAKVVQPLIAATIAFVAVENIWKSGYSRSRLFVVFGFGLIHGLGFASALGDLSILKESALAALGGFNLGVEGGQIAVISGALILTGWIRSEQNYRRWVAVPGSVVIGLIGLYWTVERLLH